MVFFLFFFLIKNGRKWVYTELRKYGSQNMT